MHTPVTGSLDYSPLTYRAALVSAVMRCVQAGESCSLVGASGMGKTALLRFLRREDVQLHYLADDSNRCLLLTVDGNLADCSEWGLLESMLNQVVAEVEARTIGATDAELIQQLDSLCGQTRANRDKLLALRCLGRALGLLYDSRFDRIVFLLDEFDKIVSSFDLWFFNHLRGLRDEYRPGVVYVTLTRQVFPILRSGFEHQAEAFYEIFSRNIFALHPYNTPEARQVILELTSSHHSKLEEWTVRSLLVAAGGHSGLLKACFAFMSRLPQSDSPISFDAMASESFIVDECKKIWQSLVLREQRVLRGLIETKSVPASEKAVLHYLTMKGIILDQGSMGLTLFSPLFVNFVKQQSPL